MTSIVNSYYPIDYLALTGVDQSQSVDPRQLWASIEALPPATETLTFDVSSVRPINCITFEIIGKPIDFTIQWFDGTEWNPVIDNPEFNNMGGVTYLGGSNPWIFVERHFETVSTQQIMITFTRVASPFPLPNSALFPWSIDVRNFRILYEIDSVEDYQDDAGTDILGNSFRTELYQYGPSNMTDGNSSTYWKSFPHIDPAAVESIYLDLRDIDGNPIVIDEVYLDPITYGPNMHMYYSNDDSTSEWDLKLWTPVPRHYILKKGYASLPSSTALKYLKLEFSNLTPIPYNTSEYPNYPSFTYNRYPSWVQNYFKGIYTGINSLGDLVGITDTVDIDPLGLGFVTPSDLLSNVEPYAIFQEKPGQELQDFITGIVAQQSQVPAAQQELESDISFRNSFQWQTDLSTQLDKNRALSRIALQMAENTSFQSEGQIPVDNPPAIQSVPDLAESQDIKLAPMMWFPMTCRHSYQVVRANRTDKIAYYVGIKELGVYRNNYNVINDPNSYTEILGDEANVRENDFLQVDDFWVVGEALLLTHPTFKQTSVGRIRKNRTLNQTGTALIQLGGKSKTQTATAHVQVSRVKTQSAVGRISINKIHTQPAKANIISTTTLTFWNQTNIARPTPATPALAQAAGWTMVPFTNQAGLTSALNSIAGNQYIYYNGTAPLTITTSGGFLISNKSPSSMAVIDFGTMATAATNNWGAPTTPNFVTFKGTTRGIGFFALQVLNCSNLAIYGGAYTGLAEGACVFGNCDTLYMMDQVHHDIGLGGRMQPTNNGAVATMNNCTIRWEVGPNWCMDPVSDTAHNDHGTGIHCCNVFDVGPASTMTNNTIIVYGHDSLAAGALDQQGNVSVEGGGGSVVEFGQPTAGSLATGNRFYCYGKNNLMHPSSQTGGNVFNLWGPTHLNGNTFAWGEGEHITGTIVHGDTSSWNQGGNISVMHGRSHGGAGVGTNLFTGAANGGNMAIPYPTLQADNTPMNVTYNDCT